MLFKNIVPYRLPENCAVQAQDLEIKLSRDPLQACGGLQMESRGWTHPHEDEANLFQFPASMCHVLAAYNIRTYIAYAYMHAISLEMAPACRVSDCAAERSILS